MTINKPVWAFLLSVLFLGGEASSHTLFIKPDGFVTEPHSEFVIKLIDGTFVSSASRLMERSIQSVGIFGPDGSVTDLADQDPLYSGKITILKTEFGSPGTYLVGVATRPRKVVLDPESFNFYLRYEGLFDEQRERAELGETNIAVVERYSKFAKAIVQVGDAETPNYSKEIGFDVEIVPQTNPYSLGVGDVFRAMVLRDREPLANELVYATHEGHYEEDEEGIFDEVVKVRSDAKGLIEFEITAPGKWYVRFIDLKRLSDAEYWYSNILVALGTQEQQIAYESKWATLTFEVR